MDWNLVGILQTAFEKNASDVHLTVGLPPIMRIRGELMQMADENLTPEDVENLSFSMMNEEQLSIFERDGEVDFSWSLPKLNRYRVNVYKQRSSCAAALRMIPNDIPKFEDIGLPEIFKKLALKPRGLVLVTGPTGSGKTTTLAAMTGHINKKRKCHIITIEDPIEYMHKHELSMINQREVGGDTKSFGNALRSSLREDPDVILVGEMRDYETIATAISAAETGHFVMSTLHTTTASQTIDRIIDSFPASQQQQIRVQLASILEGIVCQQLIRSCDRQKFVPAFEILLFNDAVRNLVREGKVPQIDTVLQTNIHNGMMPMDYSLAFLVKTNQISKEDALARCVDPEIFMRYLSGVE